MDNDGRTNVMRWTGPNGSQSEALDAVLDLPPFSTAGKDAISRLHAWSGGPGTTTNEAHDRRDMRARCRRTKREISGASPPHRMNPQSVWGTA